MSEESNVCAVCGGVEVKLLVHNGQRVCPGHPEPAPKHDGKLTADHIIYHNHDSAEKPVVIIEDVLIAREFTFTPQEALSLLAWLTQERDELQRLAKEQGRGE